MDCFKSKNDEQDTKNYWYLVDYLILQIAGYEPLINPEEQQKNHFINQIMDLVVIKKNPSLFEIQRWFISLKNILKHEFFEENYCLKMIEHN